MSKTKLLLDVISDMRSLAESIQAVADAMAENELTVDDPIKKSTVEKKSIKPKTPLIAIEDVRAVLVTKQRTQVKELLHKYGSEKLSGIDSAKYAALLAEAEVLTNVN